MTALQTMSFLQIPLNRVAPKFKIGDHVIYDRQWIVEKVPDPLNPPPVEGIISRISLPFDSGVFNVDINCAPLKPVLVVRSTNDYETIIPTTTTPHIQTAPAEYCYHLDPWKKGKTIFLSVNQGIRDAKVCARIGLDVLVEYAMPAGTTALRVISICSARMDGVVPYTEARGHKMSYNRIPKKWLNALDDRDGVGLAGLTWNPQ